MKLRRRTRQRQRVSIKKVALAVSVLAIVTGISSAVYLNLSNSTTATASSNHEPVFSEGSFIIDLSQPVNSTKAAAFIWEMIRENAVPVSWLPQASDNRFKNIDGVDYEEGALVVPKKLITSSVAESIRLWQKKGVMGHVLQHSHPISGTIEICAIPDFVVDSSRAGHNVCDSLLLESGLPSTAYTYESHEHPTHNNRLSVQLPDVKHPKPLLYSFIDGCLKKQLFVKVTGTDQIRSGEKSRLNVMVYGASGEPELEWSSSAGGRFERQTNAADYVAPLTAMTNTTDIIRLRVHSNDGHEALVVFPITILPLENKSLTAVDFRCYLVRSSVYIKWSTQKETNTDFYTVECSIDGLNWSVLTKQNSCGSRSGNCTYEYRDDSPAKGIVHYRVSKTGFDGRSLICGTSRVNTIPIGDAREKLDVAQTVFETSFAFKLNNPDSGSGELRLYTQDGMLVDKRNYTLQKGTQTLFYIHNKLKTGAYIAVFQSGKGDLYSARVEKI